MQKIDETFQEDINSVWAKKLIGEFYYINNTIDRSLCGKSLKDPNFAFDNDPIKWGTWDSLTRTITISYNLLRNYEWDAVVHTLKHEVAHMIVSEIWGDISDNGQHHGELFSKACKILGIDDKSHHSSIEKGNYHLPEKEKVLSRIYKLFCLGESNHKSEAEAAVSKAHELMIKYNISIKELPKERRSFVKRPVGYIYEKVPTYIKSLARIICQYYSVKHIFIPVHRRSHFIEFFGEPANVDVSEYIFHFLITEGERQWAEFQKTEEYMNRFKDTSPIFSYDKNIRDYKERKKGKYNKVAFIEGVYSGFASTLENRDYKVRQEADPNNTLPIGTTDPLLNEKYKANYHPHNWNSGGGSSGGGFSEGSSVGKGIVIRQGVTRGGGCAGLLKG